MKHLSPEALEQAIARQFPPTTKSWAQATDEVRDMCRGARILAGLPEDHAVDFRALTTPGQWNTQGIEGIVKFYKLLSIEKQTEFCASFNTFLASGGTAC